MKILFSPSEAKSDLSIYPPISSFYLDENFKNKTFNLKQEKYTLKDKRFELINEISSKIQSSNDDILKEAFGTTDIDKYKINLLASPTQKAILRYTGVAYEALDYDNLDKKAQEFIDKNVVIFSNIFGAVFADDKIPLYKLKQGKTIDNINIPKYYKTYFSQALDELFENEEIIDLRADFYTKFYSIKKDYHTFKFIKNNKTINHYSKHYRGVFLNILANLNKDKKISINDFLAYVDKNFVIIQTEKKANKTTTIVEIKD